MTEGRIYLDANVFIYAIEGDADIADPLRKLFELLGGRRGTAVTSELTLAEVLAGAADVHRRNYLDLIVWSRVFELYPVDRDILVETAEYRRHSGMPKLPDAIHVVTAIPAGCRTILSGDSRLKVSEGFNLIVPDGQNIGRLTEKLS
jgi:predicted nucleic acid-binding protein